MKKLLALGFFLIALQFSNAQYSFKGYINTETWHENVYLSVVEDYRKMSGVFFEQIISQTTADSTGYFEFSGNQLELENRIYRIHVDNCSGVEQDLNHFNGHCNDSKEVVFIAKNTDTIQFPFSFDSQMFCLVESRNEKAMSFIKIDSLKEDMRYAFGEFRSEANRKLNNKKWFKKLQDYGKQLNEPLAELYIYAFLSDRSNNLHEYYLEDLKTNPYYEDLLTRLSSKYPSTKYLTQYKNELKSDEYILSLSNKPSNLPKYLLYGLLLASLAINILLWKRSKNQKTNTSNPIEKLTKQEQNILNLILEDKTNKEIAEALFVSLSTVKTHTNNIYKKLNVQSREEAKTLLSR
ncbi:MAG TPA: LuxR C-terminal-related transcriptional regulator [Flavobacteriaceae bacterium]|nr:LuxR C-terminal-related transcriptional regulator [Flavobacteriaceae bacterium]